MHEDDWTESLRTKIPHETLCGQIRYGQGATLYKSRRCRSWPTVISGPRVDVALDGYVVLDGRLVLGEDRDQNLAIAEEVERDLPGFLKRVDNGFFNLVVHDKRLRVTYFANDRFGGLPMYILDEPEGVSFAASYDGLRAVANHSLSLDHVGLSQLYWFGYQIAERTSFERTGILPPQTIVSIRWDDGYRTEARYSLPVTDSVTFDSIDQACSVLVETMRLSLDSLYRPDLRYGAKISAGMDSRFICSAWHGRPLATYSFGYPGSAELLIAGRLSAALGMPHTSVPLQGDFFSSLHAPIFGRHGIMEWFHQSLTPHMMRDGVEMVVDGLAGDMLVGGLGLKRLQPRWRQALGLSPDMTKITKDTERIARIVLALAKVSDVGFKPLREEATRDVDAHWDSTLSDMAKVVKRVSSDELSVEQIINRVQFETRTRRHICLQGTVCRPEVESLYPFLDRRFLSLFGAIPSNWVASKRLYLALYAGHYDVARQVPSVFSMRPFSAPAWSHMAGRLVRYGKERVGSMITTASAGRLSPWVSDGVQWRRWLAYDRPLQEGVRRYLENSAVFDAKEYSKDLFELRTRPRFSGTRFMLTTSYCAYFRRENAALT